MGFDGLEPEDYDFEVSCLEQELSDLEGNRASYVWGLDNTLEVLALENEQRIDEVTSRLDSLRLSKKPHKDDDEDDY